MLNVQAFLETEPGTRSTSEEYMMRYQAFARDDLQRALNKHQALLQTMGMPSLALEVLLGSCGLDAKNTASFG